MRPTIDQVRQLTDFATTYNWNLSIVKFPAVGNYPAGNDLNLRCISTDLPKMAGESMTVQIRGHKVNQPGIYNYEGNITLTFIETVDSVITEFLREWREACWQSKTGVANKKSDVEATIRIARLDRQDNEIYEYILTGGFLESYEVGELGAEGGDGIKPTLSLKYDYFIDRKL